MKANQRFVNAVIGAAIAINGSLYPLAASAAHEGEEQCAGIVKAGKNDCATSRNQCHGHVTTDGDAEAWLYVPKGTCDRLVGGRVVSVVDPTPTR